MEMHTVKALDAWIGRLIDFFVTDPARRLGHVRMPAAKAEQPVKKTARPRKPKLPAPRPATEELIQEADGGPAQNGTGPDHELDGKIFEVFERLESASLKELMTQIGATRYSLSQRLKRLTVAGRVRRVGAGLKTRYEPSGSRET